MKPTIDVDAVVTAQAAGKPTECNLCLHFEGGYPVTELGSGKISYVVWLDLDKAEEMASRMEAEIARAKTMVTK
jgi:hypothetical protein